MKFKTIAAPDPSRVRGGSSKGRPEWLKEWLANKGRYVILSCGHREDLNDKALMVIYVFGKRGKGVDVYCDWCNRFVEITGAYKPPPIVQEELPSY